MPATPDTLQELQDSINVLVANDNDTPETDDDEWATRTRLIGVAVQNWGTSKDILWEELWATYSSGENVITAATAYPLTTLTDYRFPGKWIRILVGNQTIRVRLIKPSRADAYQGHRVAYITGSQKAGYTLNLCWNPVDGDGTYGGTFQIDYYKFPTKPAAAADKVEMSDPNYIVYWVAAQKALLEGQRNKFSVYDGMATDCMDNMVIMNDVDNDMQDIDAANGAVIGE